MVMLFPAFFYSMNGVKIVPEGGMEALRIYSLCFIVKGFNILIRLYLANRKDSGFAIKLNLGGFAVMPAIAYLIAKTAPAPWIFLAYTITETIIFAVLSSRFVWWKQKDKAEDYNSGQQIVLYMTVTPDKATDASRDIRRIAEEYGIDPRIANRVALSMEEMVAYADSIKDSEKTDKKAKNKHSEEDDEFSVQIMVRFRGKDAATFVTYDDGQKIHLNMDEDEQELTTNNYELIRRLATSLEYQYVLDMNYTTIRFG